MTNTLLFKGIMVAKGKTFQELADEIGLSKTCLSYKVNNKSQFVVSEIKAIQKALELTNEERDAIFFG